MSSFPPVPSPFQLLVPQLIPRQPRSAYQATPVHAPKPWGAWITTVVFSVQLSNWQVSSLAEAVRYHRCRYKPKGEHQPHSAHGLIALQGQLRGIPSKPTGWRMRVGECFSLPLPTSLIFGGDISWVLAPWMDGKSFPSPCQSFPSSSSPSALSCPSL